VTSCRAGGDGFPDRILHCDPCSEGIQVCSVRRVGGEAALCTCGWPLGLMMQGEPRDDSKSQVAGTIQHQQWSARQWRGAISNGVPDNGGPDIGGDNSQGQQRCVGVGGWDVRAGRSQWEAAARRCAAAVSEQVGLVWRTLCQPHIRGCALFIFVWQVRRMWSHARCAGPSARLSHERGGRTVYVQLLVAYACVRCESSSPVRGQLYIDCNGRSFCSQRARGGMTCLLHQGSV
jgi:hypothetical protein